MSPSFLSRSSIYSYCSRLDSASLAFQLFRYTYLKLTPKGVSPPFSLTPPPQAVQEKGDLNSYVNSYMDRYVNSSN